VDIIQLECLSQSSSTLKITNGPVNGRIWFLNGELIDAEAQDLRAEDAFRKILSWRTGAFEILPAEPERERTIFSSYQGLLLETAQALDEAQAGAAPAPDPEAGVEAEAPKPESPLMALTRFDGVEFVLTIGTDGQNLDSWGVENPEHIAGWMRQTTHRWRTLGEQLGAGQLNQMEGIGVQFALGIASREGRELCVGFSRSLSQDHIREAMTKIVTTWAS
jgi:hypothetical protein